MGTNWKEQVRNKKTWITKTHSKCHEDANWSFSVNCIDFRALDFIVPQGKFFFTAFSPFSDNPQQKKNHSRIDFITGPLVHKKGTTVKLGYSSFCALRLFCVTAQKPSERKTCQCQYHQNAEMMFDIGGEHGIVKSDKLKDSFDLVCCS